MSTTLIRRAAVLTLIAATVTALAGCGGVLGAKMTYDDVEKTKITGIRVSGAAGNVQISTGTASETSIRRIVRDSTNPGDSYRVDGSTLAIDTDCGHDCTVSYEIVAPAGVTVEGKLMSGNVQLTGVGTTDMQVASGTIAVQNAAGPLTLRASSGDVQVEGASGAVTVRTSSGNIRATKVAGPLDLDIKSGDVTAELSQANSAKVHATSGNVNVTVPAGSYRVVTQTGSGDERIDGLTSDASAKNVIDVRTGSGDVQVAAAA